MKKDENIDPLLTTKKESDYIQSKFSGSKEDDMEMRWAPGEELAEFLKGLNERDENSKEGKEQ